MNMGEFSILGLIIFIGVLLVSVGFHEAMHAFTAHRLGDNTAVEEGRLTLNPLKHVDLLMTVLLPAVLLAFGLPPIFVAKPVPFDPYQVKYGEYGAAMVALAGPFSNLLLAAIAATVLNLHLVPAGGLLEVIIFWFVRINVGLFIFNMLPIPPLDGSRLLYAFAPEPLQRIMMQIEAFGLLFVVAILLVLMPVLGPILGNLNQALIEALLL